MTQQYYLIQTVLQVNIITAKARVGILSLTALIFVRAFVMKLKGKNNDLYHR